MVVITVITLQIIIVSAFAKYLISCSNNSSYAFANHPKDPDKVAAPVSVEEPIPSTSGEGSSKSNSLAAVVVDTDALEVTLPTGMFSTYSTVSTQTDGTAC